MTSDPKKNFWKKDRLSLSEEAVMFEQYKLYVEMADRISDRRDKTNAFFLTLNTFVIGIFGFLWDKQVLLQPKWIVLFFLLIPWGFCWFWYRLVKSYRQLNSAKFHLIGEVEKKLPVRLWSTEWMILGEGKDASKYAPFSHIEQNLPWAFVSLYAITLFAYCLK